MRFLLTGLCVLALGAPAVADTPSGPAAVKANKKAFDEALQKRKLRPLRLAESAAAEGQKTSPRAVVLELHAHGRPEDPLFVVDADRNVFHVVRAPRARGSVTMTVCNAGPDQVYRSQFALPKGHVFQGDIEVAYDAYKIIPQNTCR